MPTFDFVPKVHCPDVNQFDGVICWHGLNIRTKVGVVQQKYSMIDGYRADKKQFTHR